MSDHLDSPGPVTLMKGDDSASIGPPMGDPKTDITDVYAFRKPDEDDEDEDEGGQSILILNVNPLAPALANEFEHGAEYLIRIDTNNDARPDVTFRTTFSHKDNGEQSAKVERIDRHGSAVVISHAPVSFGKDERVTGNGDYKFYAGLRSDPFFFDLLGFIDDFNFVNGDFFVDKNVFSIVLQVPNDALGGPVSLWGRTRIRQKGVLVNDDIAARAAINTVFNHGQDKNIYNGLEPSQERTALLSDHMTTFLKSFTDTLLALSTLTGTPYSATQADGLAKVLLPDVLNYDFSKPTDYAKLNGRRLADDVIDISLSLVTNGGLKTDNVGPHKDYLAHFPYVGKPH